MAFDRPNRSPWNIERRLGIEIEVVRFKSLQGQPSGKRCRTALDEIVSPECQGDESAMVKPDIHRREAGPCQYGRRHDVKAEAKKFHDGIGGL